MASAARLCALPRSHSRWPQCMGTQQRFHLTSLSQRICGAIYP